jgi:hypothetical protein
MPTGFAVYDHVCLPAEAAPPLDATPGVYRVVGTDERTVTLLQVADAEGRRRHTGELVTLDHDDVAALESADNPDGNRSPGQALTGLLDGLAWQFRAFVGALADRPLASAVALAVLLAGLLGDRVVQAPESVFTVAVFAGSLALAALGAKLI